MSIEVKGVKYKGEFVDVQYDNPAFDNKIDDGLHHRQPNGNQDADEMPPKDGVYTDFL